MQQKKSVFDRVTAAPVDPTFGVNQVCNKDPNPNKINLCIGAYTDDNGKHYDFKILSKVEQQIVSDSSLDRNYLKFGGDQELCKLTQLMVFGGLDQGSLTEAESKVKTEQKSYKDIATVQTLSGTGALRLAMDFVTRLLLRDESEPQSYRPPVVQNNVILVPEQTWPNHRPLCEVSGLKAIPFPYYDKTNQTHEILMEEMLSVFKEAKPNTLVLLQACGNNPTGLDPTLEQWKQIGSVLKEKGLIAMIDLTYFGYASGDLQKDFASVRLFRELEIPMIIAQSLAKCMSVYAERVGALHVLTYNEESAAKVRSQLCHLIRTSYSNPPKHAAEVAKRILRDHYDEWKAELRAVFENVSSRRKQLYETLKNLNITVKGKVLDWDFIYKRQQGWFVYTEMTPEECVKLQAEHSIYIQKTGRITLTHLNPSNIQYCAKSMKAVIESIRNA